MGKREVELSKDGAPSKGSWMCPKCKKDVQGSSATAGRTLAHTVITRVWVVALTLSPKSLFSLSPCAPCPWPSQMNSTNGPLSADWGNSQSLFQFMPTQPVVALRRS